MKLKRKYSVSYVKGEEKSSLFINFVNMKDIYVFDIETDGLLDSMTKIHCLCYANVNDPDNIISTTDYDEMRKFFLDDSTKCGHNVIRFDLPAAEKILGITPVGPIIDTLPLSWYLYQDRDKHGLEEWGEFFGIKKPEIKDWSTLTSEEYIHRCSEDVKINIKLFIKEHRYLEALYESEKAIDRLCRYFRFKMECIRDQEAIGLRFDKERCTLTLEKLESEREEKMDELTKAMPRIPIKKVKNVPKVIYKKDGTLSSRAETWFELLEEEALPVHTTEIEVIDGYEEPNPSSPKQVKDWLYSLGWVPEHIKHVRDKKTNTVKKIPQIASKAKDGDVCESIKKLYGKEPKLELLSGLSILNHRIGVLKGFLADEVDSRLYGSMNGLTNTLRLQHKVLVNLPAIDKKYGREIRECLIADEGHVLCGSDLSNIEDKTKRHFIFSHDPDYVRDMEIPGYDAHLEIGKLAGMLTDEDIKTYKYYDTGEGKDQQKPSIFYTIKGIRNKAKIVNFSATYKIGAESLARNSNTKVSEARKLLDIYWERNKAIKEIEHSSLVKTIGDRKWLFNPISRYWYSLRADKDKFSTLNQGTAAYIFDIWITFLRELGLRIPFQYHDEVLLNVKEGEEERTKEIINKAMEKVNNRLKLNVQLSCGTQFAKNYAECH